MNRAATADLSLNLGDSSADFSNVYKYNSEGRQPALAKRSGNAAWTRTSPLHTWKFDVSEDGCASMPLMTMLRKQAAEQAHTPKDRIRSDLLGYSLLPTEDIEAGDEEEEQSQSEMPVAGVKSDRPGVVSHRVADLLESTAFQATGVIVIILNALVIGFETDFPHNPIWRPIECAFLIFFTVELGFRILAAGCFKFFKMPSNSQPKRASSHMMTKRNDREALILWGWNMFDAFLVCLGALSTVFSILDHEEHSQVRALLHTKDATLLRMLRLVRVLRLLRVVRVFRFMKQLYLLAYGFLEGTMAVFWVTILAGAGIYLFSIILVRTYGSMDENVAHYDFFYSHFGSVGRSMFTLFQILASPSIGSYREVIFHYPPLVAFLVVFVIFGSFGISGILTGVITEAIIEKNQARIEEERVQREKKRHFLEEQSGLLFDEVDFLSHDGVVTGALTRAEIMSHLDMFIQLFALVKVAFTVHDLERMFAVMDVQDTGQIERCEFVHGIAELSEDVRPMSIMELNAQIKKCLINVERCRQDLRVLLLPDGEGLASTLASQRSQGRRHSNLSVNLSARCSDRQDQLPFSGRSHRSLRRSRQQSLQTISPVGEPQQRTPAGGTGSGSPVVPASWVAPGCVIAAAANNLRKLQHQEEKQQHEQQYDPPQQHQHQHQHRPSVHLEVSDVEERLRRLERLVLVKEGVPEPLSIPPLPVPPATIFSVYPAAAVVSPQKEGPGAACSSDCGALGVGSTTFTRDARIGGDRSHGRCAGSHVDCASDLRSMGMYNGGGDLQSEKRSNGSKEVSTRAHRRSLSWGSALSSTTAGPTACANSPMVSSRCFDSRAAAPPTADQREQILQYARELVACHAAAAAACDNSPAADRCMDVVGRLSDLLKMIIERKGAPCEVLGGHVGR